MWGERVCGMAKKGRVPVKLEQLLDLPAGTLANNVRMELTGTRRAVIEGCRRVLEYEPDVIRLDTADGVVRFMGRGLCMNCLTPSGTVITGQILSIEFV